jgi:hypothetical protein
VFPAKLGQRELVRRWRAKNQKFVQVLHTVHLVHLWWRGVPAFTHEVCKSWERFVASKAGTGETGTRCYSLVHTLAKQTTFGWKETVPPCPPLVPLVFPPFHLRWTRWKERWKGGTTRWISWTSFTVPPPHLFVPP